MSKTISKQEKENRAVFGRWLKSKRAIHGRSQGDISKMLGYNNANFISIVETGNATMPLSRYKEFANAYGVSENTLLSIYFYLTQPEIWSIFKLLIDKGVDEVEIEFVKLFPKS
jgi:transcriptional regulator with XRE-family HTH domain